MPLHEISDGGAGLVTLVDSTLAADAANFDIQNIPGTYSALMFCLTGRGTTAADGMSVQLRMNNDSGASSYAFMREFRYQGGSGGTDDDAAAEIFMGEFPAANQAAGRVGNMVGWLHNYAGTTFHKPVRVDAGWNANTGTALRLVEDIHAVWLSTSAITRLTFFPSAGNWLAGTRLTLYGIR